MTLEYNEDLKNEIINDIKNNVTVVINDIKWWYEYDKKMLRGSKISTAACWYSESAIVWIYKWVPVAWINWDFWWIDWFAVAEPFQWIWLWTAIIQEIKNDEWWILKITSPNNDMQRMLSKTWILKEIDSGEDLWTIE